MNHLGSVIILMQLSCSNVGILSGGSGGVEKYSTIDEQAGANHLRITSGEAASNE